jgi:hypothetical protein
MVTAKNALQFYFSKFGAKIINLPTAHFLLHDTAKITLDHK